VDQQTIDFLDRGVRRQHLEDQAVSQFAEFNLGSGGQPKALTYGLGDDQTPSFVNT